VLGQHVGELAMPSRVLVLELHPGRPQGIAGGEGRHAVARQALGAGLGLGAELVAAVGLGAVAAAGDHQGARHPGVGQAEVERREAAHGQPHDMGLGDAQMIEHRLDVGGCAGLGIADRVLGHFRGRVAAGIKGDAAVAAGEVAQLGLPAAMVAGELVHEDHRKARAGLLVVQLNPVVGLGERHGGSLPRFPFGCPG
jgi:hypothetical protein